MSSSLTKGKCLSCNAEVLFGGYVVKDGKKVSQKFEIDGKTNHVCKQKEKGFVRAPQKPRERFTYDELVDQDGITRKLYSVQREGFLGELSAIDTFNELQQMIWKYRAAEKGNPKQSSTEPKR